MHLITASIILLGLPTMKHRSTSCVFPSPTASLQLLQMFCPCFWPRALVSLFHKRTQWNRYCGRAWTQFLTIGDSESL